MTRSPRESIEYSAQQLVEKGREVIAATQELFDERQITELIMKQVIEEVENATPFIAQETLERALARHLIEQYYEDVPIHASDNNNTFPLRIIMGGKEHINSRSSA
jgi:hypothetical protein